MKLSVLLLPLHLLIISGADPQQTELLSRWDIFTPDLFFCSDGPEFIFRFDVSDMIQDHMVKFGLYRGSCELAGDDTDIWDNNYLIPTVHMDSAPIGVGDRIRQMIVSLEPNVNLLALSPVYTISGDGKTGTIGFCIIISLYLHDLSALVNFKEVEYAQDTIISAEVRKLEFDMNSLFEPSPQYHRRLVNCAGGFDVVFENWWLVDTPVTVVNPVDEYNVTYDNLDDSVDPDNPGEEVVKIIIAPKEVLDLGAGGGFSPEYRFLLLAYECDQNNMKQSTTVFNQGDTIRICIEPDAEAIEFGLVMKQIDSAFYSRDDIPSIVQFAVDGGQPDFYGMSEIYCIPGSLKCAVETTIRAEFFASAGMIKVTGAASFEWYWENSNRHLNHEYERDLQTGGADQTAKFSLGFAITTFQETMDIEMKGPSSLQSFLLIVLSFTLILASSVLLWIRDTRRSGALIKNVPLEKDLAETYKIEDFRYDDHDDDYCETLKY